MDKIIDYYKVLGISYYATSEEIKEAYRNLVKEVHPDKDNGDADKFILVKEAYDVLSNEEKRKRYNDILFNATKVSTPVSNYSSHSEPPLNNIQKTKVKVRKPILMYTSLVFNIVFLSLLIWIYFDWSNKNVEIKENRDELDSAFNDLTTANDKINEMKEDYNNLLSEFQILDEYVFELENQTIDEAAESFSSSYDGTTGNGDSPSSNFNNPEGAFTQGSSKEHVKKIMGTPSSLMTMPLGGENWHYGNTAWVEFDKEGKVEGWYDYSGEVLKVE